MVNIKCMFYEFLRMDEKGNESHLSGKLYQRGRDKVFGEIGILPKFNLKQKLKKKARRDHKSCDKKTETRLKITSF